MTFATMLTKALRRFSRDSRANIAMTFALALPVSLGLGAVGLDYTMMGNDRARLQTAADIAALNSARELQFANTDQTKVVAVATTYAQQSLSGNPLSSTPQISATVLNNNTAVQVTISETYKPQFSAFLIPNTFNIQASATAKITNSMPICMIGLDNVTLDTIILTANAKLSAPGCGIYSNSKHSWGFEALQNSQVTAGIICAAGGIGGSGAKNFSPQAMTDCPQIPDPLSARAPPTVGGCDYTNKVVSGQIAQLSPGTYCGGLTIQSGSNVTLWPGVYIMKNGPLHVKDASTLTGAYTGFYFSGLQSNFNFEGPTTINLTAPKDGVLAGILFYGDKSCYIGGNPCLIPKFYFINSDNARQLLGTIYMPDGVLSIDANKPVADQSAYTVIVAQHIVLNSGPNLVMNTNYNATDIPVPAGVGPVGGKVTLTQ